MAAIFKNKQRYGGGSTNTNISGDNSKVIDWVDYQKLTQEEKMDGTTYYIPDYPENVEIPESDIVDSLESDAIDKALSANKGRELKEDLDYVEAIVNNILQTMLPTITPFTATTGTGNGVGYAYIPVDKNVYRAVVTNLDQDGYFVSNVVKHGDTALRLTVIKRTDGAWADNVTINGTIILYRQY